MNYVLGIDIGGTNIKYGLVDSTGSIHYQNKTPTKDYNTFSDFVSFLAADLKDKDFFENISSIGVGAPNANPHTGFIENAPNLKWKTVDIISEMKTSFSVNVKVDNDANISALGEYKFGFGKGRKSLLVITLGTGVGAGIILDKKVFHGFHHIGSEAGHMLAGDENRTCSCGGIDHLECYLSSKGIKLTAKKILGRELRFREIKEMYLNHSTEILPVIDYSADILAKSLASIYSFICPEIVVLSGGVSTLGDSLSHLVTTKLQNYIYAPFAGHIDIKVSKISAKEGAIIGAAALQLAK